MLSVYSLYSDQGPAVGRRALPHTTAARASTARWREGEMTAEAKDTEGSARPRRQDARKPSPGARRVVRDPRQQHDDTPGHCEVVVVAVVVVVVPVVVVASVVVASVVVASVVVVAVVVGVVVAFVVAGALCAVWVGAVVVF